MYAQKLNDNSWRELAGNIVFSPTVYQSAESLSPEQRAEFQVYLIVDAERPALAWNQRFGAPSYTLAGDTVERSYAVATKSAEEQAAFRASRVEQIKQLRDTKTQTGGFPAAGKWFHSDTFSRTQQLGLVLMGPSIPDGLVWKTMDGSFVPMTPTLASQIFAAAAAQDASMFAHAETLIAQVSAAPDPTTVDINAGWPATHE